MNWKEKLQLAWTNKGSIVEGFFNAFISCNDEVKAEAMKRLEICRTNQCNLYNAKGENNDQLKAVFPGKESCGGCGCDLYAKAHAMSSNCYLKDKKAENFKLLFSGGFLSNIPLTDEQKSTIQSSTTDQIIWMITELKANGVQIPDIGPDPMWEAAMTVEQEIEINKIAYQKQFEKRK